MRRCLDYLNEPISQSGWSCPTCLCVYFQLDFERPKKRHQDATSVLDESDLPLDPTYQYKDEQGRTQIRHFSPINPETKHEKYILEDEEHIDIYLCCTRTQWLYILLAVAGLLIVGIVTGSVIYGLGKYSIWIKLLQVKYAKRNVLCRLVLGIFTTAATQNKENFLFKIVLFICYKLICFMLSCTLCSFLSTSE